jgi:hypothetical protein
MHASVLAVDEPSLWLVAIVFVAASTWLSRVLQTVTGRSARNPGGRAGIAYYGVLFGGLLVSLVWGAPALHLAPSALFAGLAAGVWALVAQALLGKRTG